MTKKPKGPFLKKFKKGPFIYYHLYQLWLYNNQ